MFADDYEYFGYRSLCGDWSLSFIVGGCKQNDELGRFSDIISGYERLRHNSPNGEYPDGEEAILRGGVPIPISYKKLRLYNNSPSSVKISEGEKPRGAAVSRTARSRRGRQTHQFCCRRATISAKSSCGRRPMYMTSVSTDTDSDGKDAIRINAKQDGANGYARIDRVYEPTLDLGGCKGIGVYIHGDGKGEKLDFQLRSPKYTNSGLLDRLSTSTLSVGNTLSSSRATPTGRARTRGPSRAAVTTTRRSRIRFSA